MMTAHDIDHAMADNARGEPVPANTADAPRVDSWARDLAAALADVRARIGATATVERRPLFLDATTLLRTEFAPTPWLVTNLVTRGGIAMLGAEPKAGKTWLATEIAMAVSSGTPVCGEFYAERGRAVYFFAEDHSAQIRNRLRALAVSRGLEPHVAARNLHVCPRGQFLDVTRDEDVAWIVASCRRVGGADLVVLDPLRDISSAAEDKSDEMAPVMRRLRLIGELLGATVLVAHHASKPTSDGAKRRPGQRMRGSSAIYGSTDSGLYLALASGNGVNEFTIAVDAEVKGARSAGHFEIKLAVEDDATGAAVGARWRVERNIAQKARDTVKGAKERADDDAMFAFVRELAARGEVFSRRALRTHDACPVAERPASAALDRLIEAGRLGLVGSRVEVPVLPSRAEP
jgi:hypothetical protein